MVQSADLWDGNNFTFGRRLNATWDRRVAIKGQVWPGTVIVVEGWRDCSHAASAALIFEVGQPRPSWSNFATLAAVLRHVAKNPQDAAIVADRGRYYIYAANRGRLAGTTVGTSIF